MSEEGSPQTGTDAKPRHFTPNVQLSAFGRLVRDPEAARILSEAYNDWVNDYCGADRKRLFPCAVLPLQSVEYAVAELQRVAKMGFKAAAFLQALEQPLDRLALAVQVLPLLAPSAHRA